MSRYAESNDTIKRMRGGNYRFLSLNGSGASDEFSRMVIRRMTELGNSTTDEKHWTLGEMQNEFLRGNINVYPDYQRGLVSDLKWARELCSVCLFTSAPIAPIYLYKTPEGHYDVVDGSQRLAAYFSFMMGSFPIIDDSGEEHWFCDTNDSWHWNKIHGSGELDGVEAVIDQEPVKENLIRFHSHVISLIERQRAGICVLPSDVKGRFLGRKQSIVVMPETWDRELCILYVVYVGLKAWKQTKDECLVHLYDRASRKLKPLENKLRTALEESGINVLSPTRQLYGVIVRVFAILEQFPHVPSEADEKLYIDLMMEMVKRYSTRDPDPESILTLQQGIEWFKSHGCKFKNNITGNRPINTDFMTVLLYTAGKRPKIQSRCLSLILIFMGRSKPKRAELLESCSLVNADKILTSYQDATNKSRGSINLSAMCEAVSHIPS